MTPSTTSARQWGIRLDGCGPQLESLINQHIGAHPVDDYTLVEVGSAGCVTLRAFTDIIDVARSGQPWRTIGFDLPPGKAWSLDMNEVARSFAGLPWNVIHHPVTLGSIAGGMSLQLMDDPRAFLRDQFPFPIDMVFIDGCHGKCAGRDFLAIEAKVREGGLVVFHDYGELEQGTDFQSHCREFISVRSYVHRLGLNQPCNEPRKGWRWVTEIKGSRHWGGDGNSCAVIQRTRDPLVTQPALSLD